MICQNNYFASSAHTLAFLLLLLLGSYLRFFNLSDNPAWYTDETTHIEIARWLMRGEIRYFAIQESWLIFARLPAFEYLLAGVMQVFGVSITALRGLTASLGIVTGVLLYFGLWDITQERRIGLVVSAVWFIFPQAVLYNRLGFSYNLLCPGDCHHFMGLLSVSLKAVTTLFIAQCDRHQHCDDVGCDWLGVSVAPRVGDCQGTLA